MWGTRMGVNPQSPRSKASGSLATLLMIHASARQLLRTVCFVLCQVGFFEIVAMPLMRTYCSIFPSAQPLMESLTDNFHMWSRQLQASQAVSTA